MGKSDFFSFGDEDVAATVDDPWGDDSGAASSVGTAVISPPAEPDFSPPAEPDFSPPLSDDFDLPVWDGAPHEEKGAEHSRGDSELGSSAKRRPPSLRVLGVVVLALCAGAIVLGKLANQPSRTGDSGVRSASAAPTSKVGGRSESAAVPSQGPAAALDRPSRTRQGAERQQAQKKKAQTRRRARRHRGRPHSGSARPPGRHRNVTGASAGAKPEERAAPPPESATEALPPEPEPEVPSAPAAPAPEPESSSEGEIRDGATSPEFGL